MNSDGNGIGRFIWRTTAVHMVSYFAAGLLALLFMGYRELFGTGSLSILMRPIESPIVAIGPLLQAVMGIALALILFPFREIFIGARSGWLKLLLLIAGLSVFAPQVPGPGTFEGLVYTKLSIADHLAGLPETFAYSLCFSSLLPLWYEKPKKAWNALAAIAIGLIAASSLLGYAAAVGAIKA
jgi:hypothetical protein